MGVFHVFKIVQMLPNRATHHMFTPIHKLWRLFDMIRTNFTLLSPTSLALSLSCNPQQWNFRSNQHVFQTFNLAKDCSRNILKDLFVFFVLKIVPLFRQNIRMAGKILWNLKKIPNWRSKVLVRKIQRGWPNLQIVFFYQF